MREIESGSNPDGQLTDELMVGHVPCEHSAECVIQEIEFLTFLGKKGGEVH